MKIKVGLRFPQIICAALTMMLLPHTLIGQTNIHFLDRNLEQVVRETLNKPDGELTSTDVLKLTSLYAPNRRITDLSGLEAALNLTVLDAFQNDITNAAALASLPWLSFLNLSYNHVHDLNPIFGLPNLNRLYLDSNDLETLPLGNMPGLTELSLAFNHISDPVPLHGLTSLRYLYLEGNPISCVGALCGLTDLQALSLREASITNANCFSCFTNLLRLDLGGNQVTDVSPLATLRSLQSLDLYGNTVSNCALLAGLTNLQILDLSGNPLSDYVPVARLTSLQRLALSVEGACGWSPLAGLTNLISLSVSGGVMTNFEWLANLRSLSGLGLPNDSISDVSGLARLTNLLELELSWNHLTNSAELVALTNLQVLGLDGNSITDISFTVGLPQLLSLSFYANRVTDLTPVAGLTNLSSLQADYNLLTNIDALRKLPQLGSASLCGNLLDLTEGSKTMGVIQDLQSNGVYVSYDPQLEPPQILVRPQWLLPAGQKSWLTFDLAQDGVYEWVGGPTVAALSLNPELIPETTFVIAHRSDYYYSWDLAITPATNKSGTVSLILVATNYAGLWTNITVQIQVVPPAPFSGEVLDASELSWSKGGKPAWVGQNLVSHDGMGAAQSGAENSWLQTTVTGPGTLRFWYRLGSDYYYGNGQFTAISQDSDLHGYEELHRLGEVWQEQFVGLPPGKWTLKWSPSWDSWDFCGLNTVWLDQVSFVPGTPTCWLEPHIYDFPGGEHYFYLHGVLGQTYDVEVSSDLKTWSPLTRVTCENFEAGVRDRKVGATTRFYRARAIP